MKSQASVQGEALELPHQLCGFLSVGQFLAAKTPQGKQEGLVY